MSARIEDGELVYRRLADAGPSMLSRDLETGEVRPSSGSFRPDIDGVSVYRQLKMAERGIALADLTDSPLNLVVCLVTGEVRELGLDVVPDPWPRDIPNPEHPRNGAHALIIGWDGLSKKERTRRQRDLASLPNLACVHPPEGFPRAG